MSCSQIEFGTTVMTSVKTFAQHTTCALCITYCDIPGTPRKKKKPLRQPSPKEARLLSTWSTPSSLKDSSIETLSLAVLEKEITGVRVPTFGLHQLESLQLAAFL